MQKQIILCFALHIYFVYSVSFDRFKESEQPRLCGFPIFKPYYRSKELCCNYTVFNRTENGKQLECCNNKNVFDPSQKICCGDQLRDRNLLEGEVYACCGGYRLFREGKDGTCCNGTFYEHKVGLPWSCCVDRIYKNGNDRCCNGKLHPFKNNEECCGSETYNEDTEWCDEYKKTIYSYILECGGDTYDNRKAVCCGGKLYNLSQEQPYLLCCGDPSNAVAYNPKTHKCEEQQAIPLDHRWCGSVHYDPNIKLCCNATVHTQTPGMSCCGNSITYTETTDCCNQKPFNKRNQKCCRGNIISSIEECCGGYKLDRNKQVCCIGRPVPITDGNKRTCCLYKLYNRFRQKCVNGKIINTTSAHCGQELYDQHRDKCCNGKLYKGAQEQGFRCCSPGTEIYNRNHQSCCNGVVKNGSRCHTEVSRCGKEAYDPHTDKCCNSKLHKNARISGLQCCRPGYQIYNPGNQTCLNGVVKDRIRRHRRGHINNCRRTCSEHNSLRLLKTLACQKHVYLIQKKKTKKNRKGKEIKNGQNIFRVRKDMFSRKKFKGKKFTFRLDINDICKCISQKSKLVLGTDVFPPKTFQEVRVVPFSKKVRRKLRSFKRKCKKN